MFGRYNFSQDAKHVPARLRERGRNSDLQDGLAQLVALEDAVAVVVAGLEEARGLRVESLRIEALRLARGIQELVDLPFLFPFVFFCFFCFFRCL